MKILYDHQIFEIQNFGGISRYFYELMSGFRSGDSIKCELALKFSNNNYLRNDEFFSNSIRSLSPYKEFLPKINFKGKGKLYNLLKNLRLINSNFVDNARLSIDNLKSGNYDLFHPTYYNDYFLNYLKTKPFILTIHDMTHEIYPQYFPITDEVREKKKKLAKLSSKILTDSNNTKEDIVKILGINEDKITVIYLGNSLNIYNNHTGFLHNNTLESIPDKYLLYVGNRDGYKNFYFFINSIYEILIKNKNLKLVCAGGNYFSKAELELFENLGINNQIIYFPVNDNMLTYLYKHAIAFIFPSLYEGFGIPILEAFACGCPIILSNSSCFPEIAQDAALYFEPDKGESLKIVIDEIIKNSELGKKLITKGFLRFQDFSWEKTVIKTRKAYEDIF
jgi:glycosyltransferase involved in cell wall biosynthesis